MGASLPREADLIIAFESSLDHNLSFVQILQTDFTPTIQFSYSFNQVKPKNDVEVRVYEVLSHKNWGASSTLMNEIAQDTFDYERCK